MMKRLVFILLVLFITANLHAQCPLSLDELKKSNSYSGKEFEDFITKKGYEVLKVSNEKAKICNCKKKLSDKAIENVTRSPDPSGNNDITYATPHKQHYDDIVADMNTKGFKFGQELPFSAYGVATRQKIYFKDKDLISVYSYLDSNRVMWYAVRVSKAP